MKGDELAWLRVQGAAEAAECLSSFQHAKSYREGLIVSSPGSGSVARLALAKNNVVRDCEGLSQWVGVRALCITECRNNLAPSLGRMTQLTSEPRWYVARIGDDRAAGGCLQSPAAHG